MIPDEAVLTGTIRALAPAGLEAAARRLDEIAQHTAQAFGAAAETRTTFMYPPVVNHEAALAYFQRAAAEVAGADAVRTDFPPMMASEDFAFFAQRAPALYWLLGLRPVGATDSPSCHHPAFDFNDDAIALAVRVHSELALRFGEWK